MAALVNSESSLLPPNSTPQERALEAAVARIGDIPAPVRETIDPDQCPEALLPWLAWALSLDAWRAEWPLHIRRARVREAMRIARRKGTAKAVRDAVASFGGSVLLSEWFQQSPVGDPHTFAMVLNVSGQGGATASAEFVDDVIGEVRRTKPARSHFTFTQGIQAAGEIGLIGATRAVVYRKMIFET